MSLNLCVLQQASANDVAQKKNTCEGLINCMHLSSNIMHEKVHGINMMLCLFLALSAKRNAFISSANLT